MPDKKELQNIKSLEQQLNAAQQLEFKIKTTDGREYINRTVNSHALATNSFFTDKRKVAKMLKELKENIANAYIFPVEAKGLKYSDRDIEKFLVSSERRALTAKQLTSVNRLSDQQAALRLEILFDEIQKEGEVLLADIELFKKNAKLSGLSKKKTLKELTRATRDKDGLVQGFTKKVKSLTTAATRRAESMAQTERYLKVYSANGKWQWITVSSKPCSDCEVRAGVVKTYSEWLSKYGVPGAGMTICGKNCRCKLMPLPIAEEKHPTVKVFDYDPEKLVLTTASDARVFRAKSNQAPQKKVK